jgi:hypothetical protein
VVYYPGGQDTFTKGNVAMAWEQADRYCYPSTRLLGSRGIQFFDAVVALYSTGELFINQVAVKRFGIKPGKVDFLIDRETKRIGIKVGPEGRWALFDGGSSSIRVAIRSILMQLEIPRPKKGEKLYSNISQEDGMLVFSYKDWQKAQEQVS